MPSKYKAGDVISSDGGEIFLYGWLEPDEAIKAIENYFDEVIQPSDVKEIKCGLYFDEVIQPSDVKEIKCGLWKYVPCRNNPEGYPGLYYPCQKCTRGAIKVTRVILK